MPSHSTQSSNILYAKRQANCSKLVGRNRKINRKSDLSSKTKYCKSFHYIGRSLIEKKKPKRYLNDNYECRLLGLIENRFGNCGIVDLLCFVGSGFMVSMGAFDSNSRWAKVLPPRNFPDQLSGREDTLAIKNFRINVIQALNSPREWLNYRI